MTDEVAKDANMVQKLNLLLSRLWLNTANKKLQITELKAQVLELGRTTSE
jgi:hypothetical protein